LGKASLMHYSYDRIGHKFLMVQKMYYVEDLRYTENIKYSLLLLNLHSKEKVLMDNHAPKGHHYHINDFEFEYEFISISQLIKDFKLLIKSHFGDINEK